MNSAYALFDLIIILHYLWRPWQSPIYWVHFSILWKCINIINSYNVNFVKWVTTVRDSVSRIRHPLPTTLLPPLEGSRASWSGSPGPLSQGQRTPSACSNHPAQGTRLPRAPSPASPHGCNWRCPVPAARCASGQREEVGGRPGAGGHVWKGWSSAAKAEVTTSSHVDAERRDECTCRGPGTHGRQSKERGCGGAVVRIRESPQPGQSALGTREKRLGNLYPPPPTPNRGVVQPGNQRNPAPSQDSS